MVIGFFRASIWLAVLGNLITVRAIDNMAMKKYGGGLGVEGKVSPESGLLLSDYIPLRERSQGPAMVRR